MRKIHRHSSKQLLDINLIVLYTRVDMSERVEANEPELKITRVQILDDGAGIPLQGWTSVENALRIFQSSRTRQAWATRSHLQDETLEDHGVLGLALLDSASARMNAGRDIVAEILQGAQPALRGESGSWNRHFDRDEIGTPFFKTVVGITKLPNDVYLLELNAAYVGKDVEDGLAETLGVEQAFYGKSVSVELEPVRTGFRIDFDAVAIRLQQLYAELEPTEKPALTGEAIVGTLLNPSIPGSDLGTFVLGLKDGVKVSLGLGKVGDRYNWRNREEEFWKAEGAVLTGPLYESYFRGYHLIPPSIVVGIEPYSEDRFVRLPVIDREMKATMNDLAERTVALLQPTS